VRKYRPQIVLAPYYDLEPGRGRGHADHIACGHVVSHGVNFAHLEKFPVAGAPHAVKKVLYYFLPPFMKPTFIVPVDEEFPLAIKALANHSRSSTAGSAEILPDPTEAFAVPRSPGRCEVRLGLLRQDVLKVETRCRCLGRRFRFTLYQAAGKRTVYGSAPPNECHRGEGLPLRTEPRTRTAYPTANLDLGTTHGN
jgi:hypothetical protein